MLYGGIERNVVAGLVSRDGGRLLSSCMLLKIDIFFTWYIYLKRVSLSNFLSIFRHYRMRTSKLKALYEAYLELYLVSYFKDHWGESRFVHIYLPFLKCWLVVPITFLGKGLEKCFKKKIVVHKHFLIFWVLANFLTLLEKIFIHLKLYSGFFWCLLRVHGRQVWPSSYTTEDGL